VPDAADPEPPARRNYVSPLRERQAQHTRDEILDALTRLLETQGADEITTRELALAAGVAERSVYRHFPDRAALVEGLTARLERLRDRGPAALEELEDLKPMVIKLMADLDGHPVEARAEALFNADPRRYTAATRYHTEQFHRAVAASLADLDDERRLALVGVVRVLVSAQTWLRLREEFDISGDSAGPIVAWVIDALVHEVERGNPPPAAR
jgi:AcrR family transcriptional regulator